MSGRPWHTWHDGLLRLALHVQPRAATTGVAGLHGDRVKIRLRAAPADGQANAELCAWLAAEFGVARGRVRLLSGASNRAKQIEIDRPATLPAWFLALGGGVAQ